MTGVRQIKIPFIKYQQAKMYQLQTKKRGRYMPLWVCLTEVEKQEQLNLGLQQINKNMRRLL